MVNVRLSIVSYKVVDISDCFCLFAAFQEPVELPHGLQKRHPETLFVSAILESVGLSCFC
jgi:hypothetical protein